MTYPVSVWEEARADIAALPERELQLAALRAALALRENPWVGEPLRNRIRVGDLAHCRRVAFDRPDHRGKPRYRLVYLNDPDDGSIAIVQVVSVGLREQLSAYKAAASRLRARLRKEIERPGA